MFYEYYQKVVSEEHLLSAREIAKMLHLQYTTGNPQDRFVREYLGTLEERAGKPQTYYHTQNGLMRVFHVDPKILTEMLHDVVASVDRTSKGTKYVATVLVNGKKFIVVLDKNNLKAANTNSGKGEIA